MTAVVCDCENCGQQLIARPSVEGGWEHVETGEVSCYAEGDPLHRTAEPERTYCWCGLALDPGTEWCGVDPACRAQARLEFGSEE